MTFKVKVNDMNFQYPAKSIPGCMFGTNLVILAQIRDDLSCGQAKFTRILSQNGQNDLEGHGQWPSFSIPGQSITGCMFAANLLIQAQICEKLSCGQDKVCGRKDRRTDGQMDRRGQRQYPLGLKGPGVKSQCITLCWASSMVYTLSVILCVEVTHMLYHAILSSS